MELELNEAIEKNRKFCCMNCDKFSCKECKETRNQISDLLEELKAYRANEGMSENVYRCGYKFGYNKAVDDTIKSIKEEYAFTILEEEKIDEIAEQLKGAKQSEDFK